MTQSQKAISYFKANFVWPQNKSTKLVLQILIGNYLLSFSAMLIRLVRYLLNDVQLRLETYLIHIN